MRTFITFMVLGLAIMPMALALVPAYVVVQQGDALGTSMVSTVNTPFTDSLGRVGFVGSLADSQRFIWWDTGPIFYSNDALPLALTGGESTMSVSDTGQFIYSPAVNSNDAVYTSGGVLLMETDAIPNLPGRWSSFNSRPTMLPSGTAYWMGGSASSQGGTTSNRHMFRATDPDDPSTIQAVLSGGDVIQGKAIKTSASNFDYWISDNDQHHIHRLEMETGSTTNDVHIYVDGQFVAQEGTPTGAGDDWQNFRSVSINNSGHYVFGGDTNAASNDEFLVYNGTIVVREGDTLDGVLLASGATVRWASMNNLDQVAHIWGWSAAEHLFFGSGAALGNSLCVLSVGDELDVDGDGVADYTLQDFNASASIGPGLDLADDGYIYVEVDIRPTGGTVDLNAVLRVPAPQPGDMNCDGLVDFDDINAFVTALSDPAAYQAAYPDCHIQNGDCNGDGLVDFDDINVFVALLSQ